MKETYVNVALDQLENEYLTEALNYPSILKRHRLRRYAAAAACLTVLLISGLALSTMLRTQAPDSGKGPGGEQPAPVPGVSLMPTVEDTSKESIDVPPETESSMPAVTGPSSAEDNHSGQKPESSNPAMPGHPEDAQYEPSDQNQQQTEIPPTGDTGKHVEDSSSDPNALAEELTFEDARKDPEFGDYMIPGIPSGFQKETIFRSTAGGRVSLFGLWTSGYNELRWQVSYATEYDYARITSIEDTANYDLSLYSIPWADSVPEELREIVDNPVFRAEELTLAAVKARAYKINDAGDTKGSRMAFSVLYGDIVVQVSCKGISPEWLYEQLMALKENS